MLCFITDQKGTKHYFDHSQVTAIDAQIENSGQCIVTLSDKKQIYSPSSKDSVAEKIASAHLDTSNLPVSCD